MSGFVEGFLNGMFVDPSKIGKSSALHTLSNKTVNNNQPTCCFDQQDETC